MSQVGYRKQGVGPLHGTILISVLAFVVVISLLLAGVMTMTVSYYSRVHTEANYASALNMAEAGINFELRKISQNPNNADQRPLVVLIGAPDGVGYVTTNGTFYVYCTNKDGTSPWTTSSSTLYIVSTGVVNGVRRTVQMSAKSISTAGGNFALFAVQTGNFANDTVVNGDLGTNGLLASGGHTTVNGTAWLNGPSARTTGNLTATHTNTKVNPLAWPTVHSIALARFPGGGLSWLATPGNNDNALVAAIHSNIIASVGGTLTFPGKVGGANYYLSGIAYSGAAHLILDNRLGPITLWLGPDGANGNLAGIPLFDFQNTCSITTLSSSSANLCMIYDSTTGPLTFESDLTLNVAIYAFNSDAFSNPIGAVDCRKPTSINAPILANTIGFGAAGDVNVVNGFVGPGAVTFFGYDDQWSEINGM